MSNFMPVGHILSLEHVGVDFNLLILSRIFLNDLGYNACIYIDVK